MRISLFIDLIHVSNFVYMSVYMINQAEGYRLKKG
jgi:hypothetical protein